MNCHSHQTPLLDHLEPRALLDGGPPNPQQVWDDNRHLPAAVADFTGDGHADLLLRRSGGIFLRAGHGDGTFAVARRILTQVEAARTDDFVVGRFTSGDALDIAFARRIDDYYESRIVLLINDGTGHFTLHEDARRWYSLQSLAAASLDGADARQTLLGVYYDYPARLEKLIGYKFADTGEMPVQRLLATGRELAYQSPRAVDLNGDGLDDLMIPRTNPGGGGTMQGLISAGRGRFTGITIGSVYGSIESILAGDATGDGVPDVLVTTFAYGAQDGRGAAFGTVVLIEGHRDTAGRLTYDPAREIHRDVFYDEDEPRLWLVAIGNTNQDARPDIVVERANVFFNSPTTSTAILLEHDNASATGFTPRTPIIDRRGGSVFAAVGYSAADIDGDGRLEIFQRGPDGLLLWWTLPR